MVWRRVLLAALPPQARYAILLLCRTPDRVEGRNKDEYTCKVCGQPFRWSPSRAKTNPIYCSLECRDKDPERTAMLRRMNADQQAVKINSLERAGYEIIQRTGVHFEPQTMIGGKFCVDAFIPQYGIVIQFDGDYWHAHPDKFAVLSERQHRRVRIDRSQNAYFAKCGYTVLRFWESEVRNSPDDVEARLRHVMQSLDVQVRPQATHASQV